PASIPAVMLRHNNVANTFFLMCSLLIVLSNTPAMKYDNHFHRVYFIDNIRIANESFRFYALINS
ncbi:MAG: hypothetical protein PHT21_05610, partial [Lachnospiraceae bacterium]|nr:hypothetical protein [Lachnospiraceae bacterium]